MRGTGLRSLCKLLETSLKFNDGFNLFFSEYENTRRF